MLHYSQDCAAMYIRQIYSTVVYRLSNGAGLIYAFKSALGFGHTCGRGDAVIGSSIAG
jgi:hypothetical protein